MPTRAYLAWANPLIKGFVGDSHTRIELSKSCFLLVARDAERPKYIYGWALFCHRDALTLLYAFVKKEHQKQGICKALLAEAMEQSGEPLAYYASRTRFDDVWIAYGMEYLPIQVLEVAA